MPESYAVVLADGVFRFTTDHPVSYSARFLEMPLPASIQLAGLVFDFSFFPDVAEAVGPDNARVAATILHLVRRFFETGPEYILLYICESTDGRELARYRLFGKWLRENDPAGQFRQWPIEITSSEPAIIGGLVFRQGHPLRELIGEFLQAEIQVYNDAKSG